MSVGLFVRLLTCQLITSLTFLCLAEFGTLRALFMVCDGAVSADWLTADIISIFKKCLTVDMLCFFVIFTPRVLRS